MTGSHAEPTGGAAGRSGYDGLLLDLDGVVYVGPEAVPGAVQAIGSATAAGLRVGYVTNNANRPAPQVAQHLRDLGLSLADDDVVTSAQIAAQLVLDRFGPEATVLPLGGPGVRLSLDALGLSTVDSADEHPTAVVQGYGPQVGWQDLAEAAYAIHGGAHWVATNTDLTIPQPRGIAPGNGTLVAAVRHAVGIDPEVAGKPQPVAFEAAARRLRSSRPLVVGDRLDTDIEGGNAAGMDTLMVLTGVHGIDELLVAAPSRRPMMIADDLDCLDRAWQPLRITSGCVQSDGWRAVDTAGQVELTGDGSPAEAVRAVTALVWAARDTGVNLEVPGEVRRRCGSRAAG